MIATASWNKNYLIKRKDRQPTCCNPHNSVFSFWTQCQIRDTHHNIPHQRALTLATHGTTIAPAAVRGVSHHHVDIIMGNLWQAQVPSSERSKRHPPNKLMLSPSSQTHLQQSIYLVPFSFENCLYCWWKKAYKQNDISRPMVTLVFMWFIENKYYTLKTNMTLEKNNHLKMHLRISYYTWWCSVLMLVFWGVM